MFCFQCKSLPLPVVKETAQPGMLSHGLVRSLPGPISEGLILSLVGMCLIKRVYSTKVGGRMSDIKKHNFMCGLFHFLYRNRDTLYQLMSVYEIIECP